MRRGPTITDPERYCRVRLQYLYGEKKKTPEQATQLILDKGIYELSIVLDLIVRNKQKSRLD